jgi:signal transduction histidine kinase
MKLLNRSLQYLALFILIVVGAWSVIFYLNFRGEIYEVVDDSLEDQVELLDDRVRADSTLLSTTSFENSLFSITPISREEVDLYRSEVFKDTLMTLPYDNDLKQVRLLTEAFYVNGEFYKYQAISSTVEEDDLIESLFWFIVWLYAALILTVILVNNWALKALWSPFYTLLDQLKKFRVNQDSELPELSTKTTEFKELKKAADELIERTVAAYSSQKQFTENAAHELQTPIAIIRSKLELLLEQSTLSNNDAEKVGEVLEIATRLTHLNKSLLLLSKIENDQFIESERISVSDLVKRQIRDMEDVSMFRDVTVDLNEETGLFINVNAHLAEILFRNLLVNAINHNKRKGEVKIEIFRDGITICNTSENAELNKQVIFKRFSKNKVTKKGTGLGLAIVKAICDLYGFDVNYTYRGMHCFTVWVK